MQRTEPDGIKKIVESTAVENGQGDMISLEQKVTYIEPDGTTHVYNAIGELDTIIIMMPDSQRIDVEFAKDSIEGYRFNTVIVGVESADGALTISEDTMDLVADYGYWIIVAGDGMTVTVDNNVVDTISEKHGDAVLSIRQAIDADLTPAQKRTIGKGFAVNVTLTVDGEYVSDIGGYANISVQTNDPKATVYYVDANGGRELQSSTYSEEGGNTSFTVSHFSIYLIEYPDDKEPASMTWLYILIGLIVLLLLILIIVLWRRKKDPAEA
jgi:LPXTG-motif cell wall-anchored protein